jgi:hypothetical protein
VALSFLGFPGGSYLTEYATREKRRTEAREILIEQISSGLHGPVYFGHNDLEQLIAATLRFSKALETGAARENLIVLAQIMAGLQKNKVLRAEAFCRWAEILEKLTPGELLLIAIAYRAQLEFKNRATDEGARAWVDVVAGLRLAGYTERDIEPLVVRICEFGLLVRRLGVGGIALYEPSQRLMELGKLADLQQLIDSGYSCALCRPWVD